MGYRNYNTITSLRQIESDKVAYEIYMDIPYIFQSAFHKIMGELGIEYVLKGKLVPTWRKVYLAQNPKYDEDFAIFGYRRYKIRDYIIKHFDNYALDNDDFVEPQAIICSEPRKAIMELIEKETFGDYVYMVYDRTDNWSALTSIAKKVEPMLFEKADVITCSSKYLCQTVPEEYQHKVKYVPNGNELHDRDETIEKYKNPTAIYVGNNLEKFGGLTLYKLAVQNPDWTFLVYVNADEDDYDCMKNHPENVEFRGVRPMDELFRKLQRCHVGLLLFNNDEWCQGMLPLKLFNYINAHIPVLYTPALATNLEDYDGKVAFCTSDVELKDLHHYEFDDYDSYMRTWKQVLEDLFRVWELPDEIK